LIDFCSRVSWPIRHDLVPLFGPTFPATCLAPDQPGYGTVIPPTGRRKPRRSLQSVGIPPAHSVPCLPKLSLAKDFSHDAGHYLEGTGHGPIRTRLETGNLYPPKAHSSSPASPHATPFAPPVIPVIPSLVPANGACSVLEHGGASHCMTSPDAYSPLRESPSRVRYAPYTLPKGPDSPPASHLVPSALGYDLSHNRSLIHRASAPNLRSVHSRGHVLEPRLSLNTRLPVREAKRQLAPLYSAPEESDIVGNELRRFVAIEEFFAEGCSGDSAPSATQTPPFSE